MKFNQKGNALSVIMVAVLILATIAVMTSHFISIMPSNLDSTEKIKSETNLVVEKSILTSLDEVMNKGFSDNSIWYYNNPSPPLLPEVDEKMRQAMLSDVNGFLIELEKERDYNFGKNTSFKLKIDFSDSNNLIQILNEVKNLPEDYFEIEVKNLYVSSFKGDKNKTLNLSEEKVFALRSWLLYKELFLWVKDLDLASDSCSSLARNTSCQLSYCWCGDTTTAMVSDFTIEDYVNFPQVINDFNQSISNSLTELNSQFAETGITCVADYSNLTTDYTVSREQVCVNNCPYNSCAPGDTRCGELFSASTDNCSEWGSANNLFSGLNQRKILIKNKEFEFNEIESKEKLESGCGQATLENLAVNSGIFSVIKLTCSDSESFIGGFEKIRPLQAKINLIVSVISACQPENVHPLTAEGGCPNFIGFNEGKGEGDGDGGGNGDEDNPGGGDGGGGGQDNECDPAVYSSRCYSCVGGEIVEKPIIEACPGVTASNCESIQCKETGCKIKPKCPSACSPCNQATGECIQVNCVAETGDACSKCRAIGSNYSCVIEQPDCSGISNACETYESNDNCGCRLVNSVSCNSSPICNGNFIKEQECNPSTGSCEFINKTDCSNTGRICKDGICTDGFPL